MMLVFVVILAIQIILHVYFDILRYILEKVYSNRFNSSLLINFISNAKDGLNLSFLGVVLLSHCKVCQ